MNLPKVVVQTYHLQPLRVWRDHAPAGQVVQRRAPQHRFFAACIHGDIAANARGFSRCGVYSKYKTSLLSGIGDPLGHHASLGGNRGKGVVQARQLQHFHFAKSLQFFSVDDRTFPTERNGATGVAGATTARHDGQTQINAGLDQLGHFCFCVRRQHHKRVFHPPIGGIGDMRHTAHGIKADIVVIGAFAQSFMGFPAQKTDLIKALGKGFDTQASRIQQLHHHTVAFAFMGGIAALVDLTQAVLQSLHQLLPTLGVVQ